MANIVLYFYSVWGYSQCSGFPSQHTGMIVFSFEVDSDEGFCSAARSQIFASVAACCSFCWESGGSSTCKSGNATAGYNLTETALAEHTHLGIERDR